MQMDRLQPTGSSDGVSPLARGDSSSMLSRRASQAEAGITPRGRRASQAQVVAMNTNDGGLLEAVGAALDPSYTDVEGMLELLEKARAADMSGNISVQILEAKYDEAKTAGSSGSDSEEELSLQDKIDDALDPGFDDHVAMRAMLDEADATYFQHPMVNILRAKVRFCSVSAQSFARVLLSPGVCPLLPLFSFFCSARRRRRRSVRRPGRCRR